MSYIQFLAADRAAFRVNNISPPDGYTGIIGPLTVEAEDAIYWAAGSWATDNTSPGLFVPGAGQTTGAGAFGDASRKHIFARNFWTNRIAAFAPKHPTLGVIGMRVLRNSDGALVMSITYNQNGPATTAGGLNGTTPEIDTDNGNNGPLPYDDYRLEFIAVSGAADLDKISIN